MGQPKVCHICLIMNINMYDLRISPMANYYSQVVGENSADPFTKSDLSVYACYECGYLLKKFCLFKQKCLQALAILDGVTKSKGEVTTKTIKSIDRYGFQITSNLTHTHIKEDSIIHYIYDDISNSSVIINHIKKDVTPLTIVVDECVKMRDTDDFLSEDLSLSSDENEPLSHHKEKEVNKEVKGEDKIENIRRKDHKEVKVEEDDDEVEDLEYLQPKKDVTKKQLLVKHIGSLKKRGRPKNIKAEVSKMIKKGRKKNPGTEFEEYATVINLSLEEQIEEVKKRQESANYMNSPFQCKLCYRGFIDSLAWEHHVFKHSPSAGNAECVVCKLRFKKKHVLDRHLLNHERKYACKSCPEISFNANQARLHQKWHKGVTYICKYCSEVFNKWTSYMSHVRIKHPSEFICGVCGYSFVSKLGLTMHKTRMHKDHVEKPEDNDKEKENYCKECDVKFDSTEAWKRHVVMSVKHTKNTGFIEGCRLCGDSFGSAEELREHQRMRHARTWPRYHKTRSNISWPIHCKLCPEQISSAREYWNHFRRMHPGQEYPIQKNYVCDICGKGFTKSAFLIHKHTHMAERPHACAHCGKMFSTRTQLRNHEKSHSDARPYPCPVCAKAFKFKGALNKHSRCHTGEKPYECELCGKAFTQSNSKKLHVRTVHLKQPAPYRNRSRLEPRKKPQPQASPEAELLH